MNTKTFTLICVSVTILGILVMFFANKLIQPENVKISQIKFDKNYVSFVANVTKVQRKTGLTILIVKDETGSIEAILYENQTRVKPGDKIEITGKTQKYKEKIQVRVLNINII